MVFDLSNNDIVALMGLERIADLTVEQPALPFGGYAGDKAMISLIGSDGLTRRVLLKRTRVEWARKEGEGSM